MKLADLPLEGARFDPRFAGLELGGIAADSRKVKPGDLFVAIAGAKADGAHFAKQAAAAGAVAATGMSVQCDDCLFATKATTPQTPLYVVRASSTYSPNSQPLIISGSRNYYRNTQLVLQLDGGPEGTGNTQYTFDELTLPDAPSWYREENPEPVKKAVFSWDTPSQTVDRQTLHDFIPPSFGDGWFTLGLGLVPAQLPSLPDMPALLEDYYGRQSPYATPTDAADDLDGQ